MDGKDSDRNETIRNRAVLPERPGDLDNWLEVIGEFDDRFKLLVRGVVYLWKVRELLDFQTLDDIFPPVQNALKSICEMECGGYETFLLDLCEREHCPVAELLGGIGRRNASPSLLAEKPETGGDGSASSRHRDP